MSNLTNEIITDIRKEHKLSRKALENISGFKARTIESYERGQNPPSKEYIEFISLYFGYKKEYIEDEDVTQKELNEEVRTILMFQSIYNYTNEIMADLLEIDIEDYISILKILHDMEKRHQTLKIENEEHLIAFENLPYHKLNLKGIRYYHDVYIYFALKLNIKLQCFSGQLENNLYYIFDENKGNPTKLMKGREYNHFITFIIYDTPTYEQLSVNYENSIDITPEYYASIIKQRNQPNTVTPNTEKNPIQDKYKKILELLPHAPDSFIQNLEKKLISLKESQHLEDL